MAFFSYGSRALEIAWIAASSFISFFWQKHVLRRSHVRGPAILKEALEKASGSFLKFGQILSLQVDTLPMDYCDELLDLLDRVPPFPEEEVRAIFRGELGEIPEKLYLEFDYETIAAASIGQVHSAKLQDGTPVAVKVQRPGIRSVFERDAALLTAFVRLVLLLRIKTLYFMQDPVREFNDWIQDELDYRIEASNAETLRENAADSDFEKIPRIFWDQTTSRILTMDFLEGYSVREYLRIREKGDDSRLEEMKSIGFDPGIYVTRVIQNFVSDALKHGVFHADLHPANLLVMAENRVGYVDFGIVGNLNEEARRRIIQMTLGYVRGQNDEIFTAFMAVSTFTEHADPAGFRSALDRLSRRWYREPAIAGARHFGSSLTIFLIDLLALCRSYGILPRREMVKYIRSLFLTDGLVSRIAPGLDYGPQLRELCEQYLMAEAQQKFLSVSAALPLLAELHSWLQVRPDTFLTSLDRMERGEIPIRIQQRDTATRRPRPRRTFWIVLGWLATCFMAILNQDQWLGETGHPYAWLLLSLLGVWTLWLLRDLWKLTRV